MAWDDVRQFPWLVNQPAPSESFLRGAQVGAQVSSAWVQKAEAQRRAALFPLQLQAAETAAKVEALNLSAAALKQAEDAQLNKGLAELSKVTMDISESGNWESPESRRKIRELGVRYPKLTLMQPYQVALGQTEVSRRERLFLQKEMAEIKATQALAEQRLEARDSDTPQEKNLAKAQEYENQAAVAREKNDIPTAQRLERDAKLLRSAVGGRRSSTRAFSPTGEKLFEITEGPEEPGGVTPSTQSQLERRALTYGNSIAGINEVMRKVRPEHVGVQGWLGEFVVDRGLAQVFPELADKERIDSRSLLEVMKASLVRQISEDPENRFSNEDRREITGLINGISPTMSYPQLIGAFERVRETMKDRIRSYSERTGEPIPASVKTREELLSDYDKQLSAIRKSATNRQITPEQMRVEMETAKQRIAETLRRFHGVIVEFGAPQPVAP